MFGEFISPPGIRVVRVLARDHHTERLLVHVEHEGSSTPAEVLRASDEAGAVGIRSAVAALDRLQSAGIIGSLDVLDDAGTPALLLVHQRGVALSDLLVERPRWHAGEAVAVLAPLTEMLDRMHDAGVAHGALTAGRVTVLDSGVSFAGFDVAECFPSRAPEVVRQASPAVARDRVALRGIAVDILARVGGSRATAAHDLCDDLQTVQDPRLAEHLKIGLAQLAAAVPVRMESADLVDEMMPRQVAIVGAPAEVPSSNTLARFVAEVSQVVARIQDVVSRMPTGRRRIMIAGGTAIAIAGLLLAVLPPSDRSASPSAPESMGSLIGSGSPSAPEAGPLGEAGREEDPAAAAIALLERREECFRELSLLCLDAIDQVGSQALAIDRAAMIQLRDGGEDLSPQVDPVASRVVERLGDSVLVEVGPETAPASLLIMRSEAGWRIRDWIAFG